MSPAELLAAAEPTIRYWARRARPSDREDLAQAIRLRLLEAAPSYSPTLGAPSTFARQVAKHVWLDTVWHRAREARAIGESTGVCWIDRGPYARDTPEEIAIARDSARIKRSVRRATVAA